MPLGERFRHLFDAVGGGSQQREAASDPQASSTLDTASQIIAPPPALSLPDPETKAKFEALPIARIFLTTIPMSTITRLLAGGPNAGRKHLYS